MDLPLDPLDKADTVAHTIRLPRAVNDRALQRASEHPNFNAYVTWVLAKDAMMPDLPDCARCGYRHMGEYLLAMLQGETLYGRRDVPAAGIQIPLPKR